MVRQESQERATGAKRGACGGRSARGGGSSTGMEGSGIFMLFVRMYDAQHCESCSPGTARCAAHAQRAPLRSIDTSHAPEDHSPVNSAVYCEQLETEGKMGASLARTSVIVSCSSRQPATPNPTLPVN